MRLGLEAGEDTLTLANELGIRGVPIDGGALVRDGVDATLSPIRERGLEVCQIGAFGFNPVSDDGDAAKAGGAQLERIIELSPATGCRFVVIGPGNYHPSGFAQHDARNFQPEAVEQLAEGLRPFVSAAEEHGVCLCVEPYLKGIIHSAEQFLKLREQIGSDALRCNVDPSSLYDFHDAIDPGRVVRETCEGLAGCYGLVHIKEIAVSEGFHVHMGLSPLANGTTDWAAVLRMVAPHLPEESWVILEHVLSPDQGRDDYAILKAAADRAGVTLA